MSVTRRNFIRGLAGTSLAALGGCKCPFGCGKPQIALQLYSIHKIFWQRPEGILAELAEMGFDGVEFYDYNGRSAREIRAMCDAAGLRAMGVHVNGDEALVGDALKRTLDFAAEAGFESVVTPHAMRKTADEFRAFGRAMGLAADSAAPYGIKVGVHTTYAHFTTKFGNETAWDMIFKEASPLLQQQIDTGNTFHTGTDVVSVLEKYRGRHHSVHLKENEPTREGIFGEPPTDGGRCVPWDEIFGFLPTDSSVRWLVVEAEGNPASVTPARRCLDFVNKRM